MPNSLVVCVSHTHNIAVVHYAMATGWYVLHVDGAWLESDSFLNACAKPKVCRVDPGNASWSDVAAAVSVMLPPATGTTQSESAAVSGPAPSSSNTFHLKSKFNGECLDVQGKHTEDGAVVDTWTCVSATNEAFAFDAKTGQVCLISLSLK